jgi:hypothetical protein
MRKRGFDGRQGSFPKNESAILIRDQPVHAKKHFGKSRRNRFNFGVPRADHYRANKKRRIDERSGVGVVGKQNNKEAKKYGPGQPPRPYCFVDAAPAS